MRRTSDHGTAEIESREIRDLVRKVAREEGFPSFDLTLTADSTFVPAVYISFFVHSADAPTRAQVEAVGRLRKKVEAALVEHGVSRVPYIRFRQAS